jgi:hypothetical protein
MRRPLSEPFDDVTVYLVLNDHGQFGIAYDETDPAKADRETIIRNFLTGQYGNALRVVAFNTAEGWSWDVSELRTSPLRSWSDRLMRMTIWARTPSASLIGTSPIPQTRRQERNRST